MFQKLFINVLHDAISQYHIKWKFKETFLFLLQKFSTGSNVRFLYLTKKSSHVLAGETAADFTPILYMLSFGLLASVPALILSRLLSPRRRYNPVKFLPMEWPDAHRRGQVAFHDAILRLHLDVCCI